MSMTEALGSQAGWPALSQERLGQTWAVGGCSSSVWRTDVKEAGADKEIFEGNVNSLNQASRN